MKHRTRIRLLILAIFLIGTAIVSSLALAQEMPPTIPHPLKNYGGYLVCHVSGLVSASQVPDNHQDFENEICSPYHLTSEEAAKQSSASARPGDRRRFRIRWRDARTHPQR